jgi:hypothetical protein
LRACRPRPHHLRQALIAAVPFKGDAERLRRGDEPPPGGPMQGLGPPAASRQTAQRSRGDVGAEGGQRTAGRPRGNRLN